MKLKNFVKDKLKEIGKLIYNFMIMSLFLIIDLILNCSELEQKRNDRIIMKLREMEDQQKVIFFFF